MAEAGAGTSAAPAASHTPRPAAAAAAKASEDKKTITVTFEGKDLEIHSKIVADADEAERTPSINLLRHLRQKYEAPK